MQYFQEKFTAIINTMAKERGLKMLHSNQIDTYRRICSETTIQSDPDGHFAKIVEQLREKSNYPNDLLQVYHYTFTSITVF